MIDPNDNAINVAIVGQAGEFAAVFTRRFESGLDINGRLTTLRITRQVFADRAPTTADQVIIFKNTDDQETLNIRAIERGQRTVLLVLEQSA